MVGIVCWTIVDDSCLLVVFRHMGRYMSNTVHTNDIVHIVVVHFFVVLFFLFYTAVGVIGVVGTWRKRL